MNRCSNLALANSVGCALAQTFSLQITHAIELNSGRSVRLHEFSGQLVHAVAGIGNPDRFFASLRAQGISLLTHPMPDHHYYSLDDLLFDDDLPVLVTAKDAVKMRSLGTLPASVFQVCTRIVASAELSNQICLLEQMLKQHHNSMNTQPYVIVIPARYASSRFPGKPLHPINGVPMILHTAARAQESAARQMRGSH